MKKLFLALALIAGVTVFTSCEEDILETIVSQITGSATASINGSETDFTASFAMFQDEDEKATTKVIGVAATLGIEDLLGLDSVSQIGFPFLAYRLSNAAVGTYTISNPLASSDLEDFNYQTLFSDIRDNFVAVAVSETEFYVLTSGSINVTELSEDKISATFTGQAQKIDINGGVAQLFENTIPFSGSMQSRKSNAVSWLINAI